VWQADIMSFGQPVDTSGDGIFAQRYDVNGSPVGGEMRLSDGPLDGWHFYNPNVAGLADGGFVAAWEATASTPSGFVALQFRRFSAGGAKGYGESTPSSSTFASQQVVALGDGGYVVINVSALRTSDYTASDPTTATHYDANNRKVGMFTILPAGASFASLHATATPDGGYAVALLDDGSPSSTHKLYLQQFGPDAAPKGDAVLVATLPMPGFDQAAVRSFIALKSGTFAFGTIGSDVVNGKNAESAEVMLVDIGGHVVTTTRVDDQDDVAQPACVQSGYSYNPCFWPWQAGVLLAALDDGGFVAAVQGNRPAHPIVVRRFNADGSVGGGVVPASSSPQYDSMAYVTGIGNDGVVLAWTRSANPGNNSIEAHQWTPATTLK
jgi:hypothetical protein